MLNIELKLQECDARGDAQWAIARHRKCIAQSSFKK